MSHDYRKIDSYTLGDLDLEDENLELSQEVVNIEEFEQRIDEIESEINDVIYEIKKNYDLKSALFILSELSEKLF